MSLKLDFMKVLSVASPIIKAIVIVVVGYYLNKWILKLLARSFEKAGHMDASLSKFLLKAANIVIYAIILLSALNALGISTTGLLAALSAAAVGIALALKDSLSNIASGILLLIAPKFSTGDFVEVNGESGNVLQVDLMHTTIKTPDNRHIVVPNGSIMGSEIINYSKEAVRRVDLVFSISYEDNAELAKQVITETANAHPLVLDTPDKPFVRVSEYASSSVNITLRVWCKSQDYWTVHFDLTEQVRAAFDKNGISIPYDQLDVHIKEK